MRRLRICSTLLLVAGVLCLLALLPLSGASGSEEEDSGSSGSGSGLQQSKWSEAYRQQVEEQEQEEWDQEAQIDTSFLSFSTAATPTVAAGTAPRVRSRANRTDTV